MKEIKAKEMADAIGGRLLEGTPDTRIGSVCIDSRKAETGSVFFALSGERVDGHDYLEDAVLAGCTALVVSKIDTTVLTLAENRGVAVVQVKDT